MKPNALDRLQQMQELLEKAQQDLQDMQAFQQSFQEKADRIAALSRYYSKHWLKDTTALEKRSDDTYLPIRGEDTLWNLLSDYRGFQEKMIKSLADELNRR